MTKPGSKSLAGKTMVVTGGSRGIGRAIALRAAADGANITLLARTDQPHPKLPGTIHTAAAEIEAAGGRVLPFVGDVRDDDTVAAVVQETVDRFGGIDIVVNNASAIDLTPTDSMTMKKYDQMQSVNTRAAYLLSKLAIPHLRAASAAGRNPHILTLSPPLNLNPAWTGSSLAYLVSKYGMSLTTLGLAEELREDGIAANSLWPRTTVATAAVRNLLGGEAAIARSRTPEICADAAHLVLCSPAADVTGNLFLDDEVLTAHGVTELDRYRVIPGGGPLELDIFVDA
ncbi:SDR family oxidoreductase [Nocardia sp. CWNU-33]|uniref:SDR family oxidoreductase n=1 Tax=Nocardia sp. CWNU-33 TaxID=3392117 RepID=UPI00398EFC33